MGFLLDSVEAVAVSKIYGRHRALSKVSLRVEKGRILGLLGPNGSGKTTLLNLFSTLSKPTAGRIRFGDLPANKTAQARGAIGLLSHAPLSYRDLTGLENLVFFAKLHRVPEPETIAATMLERFELSDAGHRQMKTYSRGMLQRLSLARALISDPAVLLLDEPFTGLDARSRDRVIEEVAARRDAGTMVIMVSHDLATTAQLSDATAILRRGRLARYIGHALDASTLRDAYAELTEAA